MRGTNPRQFGELVLLAVAATIPGKTALVRVKSTRDQRRDRMPSPAWKKV